MNDSQQLKQWQVAPFNPNPRWPRVFPCARRVGVGAQVLQQSEKEETAARPGSRGNQSIHSSFDQPTCSVVAITKRGQPDMRSVHTVVWEGRSAMGVPIPMDYLIVFRADRTS